MGKITAIVIDDDKDTVGVFSDYLKLKNVEVLGKGNNGKEAVELFSKLKPDVVFLDQRMPEYDGLFALHHIRQKDANANVIMITAENTLDENPKVQELKPTKIIHKPFNISEVMDIIEEIMQSKMANTQMMRGKNV